MVFQHQVGAEGKSHRDFCTEHPRAVEKLRTLREKYLQNHPDDKPEWERNEKIGFFYIDEAHDDIVKLFEDCAGDQSVSDLLAKLRDAYPQDVALCEKRIAELQTDEKSDEKTIEHEDDTMEKQLIYDISDAVKLKYVKTTRWVWAGVDNGLFRPVTDESYSLEIEHYDVVFDPSSADEDEKLPVPYSADRLNCIEDARKIGEALSLEECDPFLITINGRKYYRYRVWDIPTDGNKVIDWHRYLNKAVSERCPDGWADELPDYIDYQGDLYRAETEE